MLQECAVGSRRIIHLAASTIPSAYILPKVLPEFGNLYPSTYFVLHQSDSRAVIDGVICDHGIIATSRATARIVIVNHNDLRF